MYGRICSDGSTGSLAFLAGDGAGGTPVIWLDGAGGCSRATFSGGEDAGDILGN